MITKSMLLTAAAAVMCLAACAEPATPGGTATINKLSDGRVVIDLNGRAKTCAAGQVPVATGMKTTIVTAKGTKVYPNGLLACLDPKLFDGAASVSVNGGEVVVKSTP